MNYQSVAVKEYASGAEMTANYSAIKKRLWRPQVPFVLRTPVVVPEPGPPPWKAEESILTLTDHCPRVPSLKEIIGAVSEVTWISVHDITGGRRAREISRARQIYYYVARALTPCSYPQIARSCGYRDHSTIVHGVDVVSKKWDVFGKNVNAVFQKLAAL